MKRLLLCASLVAANAFAQFKEVDTFLQRPEPPARDFTLSDGRVTGQEPRLGVPTFVWLDRRADAPDLRAAGVTPEEAARRTLVTHAQLYGSTPAQLAEAKLVNLLDLGHGAIVASFERRFDGRPVFHEKVNVVLSQRLEAVALTGYFAPQVPTTRGWRLAADTALSVAAEALAGQPVAAQHFVAAGVDEAGALRFTASTVPGLNVGLARAKALWFTGHKSLVPAWYVELDVSARESSNAELIGTVVSAIDGSVLWRRSLTQNDVYSYRVWADPATKQPFDGPYGRATTPHPTGAPDGTTPTFTSPSLVSLEHAGLSTNDPWLPSGATTLTGNNAEAYADLVTPDGFNSGDYRAATTAPGVFDATYDVNAAPGSADQRSAGLAQLFYVVNWLHDWFYDHGFDEAAGNAQTDNFGRGGAGGDSIKAEGQDFNGLNNANMSTPTDGARPRMQMYMWQPDGAQSVTQGANTLTAWAAQFGAVSFDVTAEAVMGVPREGCTALTNPAAVVGKIAVVARGGGCSFELKAKNAQDAGAVAVLILNNQPTNLTMGGDDAVTGVTIPALLISQADGTALETALGAGNVTLRMSRVVPVLRDGSLDSSVVAHEWGHYLSNRLVPGLGTVQARGMGEGWGDFVALLMTAEESDRQRTGNAQFEGAYVNAVYDVESPATATNGYYFGIRRVPYSTSFTKNALTFRHIGNGNALPTTHPVGPGPSENAEVHNTGEIWASMLWESYVALLNAQPRLSFSQAQGRMLDYVVAGLSAMPSQPTFTESRDAMLAAGAANDLEDYRLMLAAFAKRGLGTRALSPPRNGTSNLPLTEDFNAGNDLQLVSASLDDEAFFCDHDGTLDVGEQGRLRLTIRNTGADTLMATTATVTTNLPGATVGTFTFPSVAPLQTATAEATVQLPTLMQPTAFILTVTFADPTLPMPGTRVSSVNFAVNLDDLPATLASDNAEPLPTAWSFVSAPAPVTEATWSRTTQGALAHRYYGPNPAQPADISMVSPALVVGTGPFSFTFTHRYDFEIDDGTAYDGAVLELSTDDGATWTDIGAQATPGYNVTLDNEPAGTNPLKGRAAFGGQSTAYPAWVNETVSLGTTWAGQTVKLRLRIGADTNTAATGWDVDDFVFTGLTNTPFPSRVADRKLCVNRPPVANAGDDFEVLEGAMATLNSSASTDPDMNTLTATWTQVSGTPVTLNGNQFTAPMVMANEELVFALRVNDGTVDSANTDEVTVTVRNRNEAPVVTVSATQTVDERSAFLLDASAVDAEGDALTVEWRQVSGPMALLGDTRTWRLQGAAPEVTANAVMVFEVTVRDAMNQTKAQVTVNVTQVNRAPTVRVLAATPVDADAVVNLEAVASDADGDTVTITWRQVSGPPVQWDSLEPSRVEFRAPEAGSRVVMEASVSDGTLTTTAQAAIEVRAAMSAGPRAVVTPDVTVESGGAVQLSAAGSSGTGTLQYQWEQIGLGSRLSFDSTSAQSVTVTAPTVTTRERLNVQLRVRDASGQVASAVTHVIVEPKAASGCGCVVGSGFEPLLGLVALALLRRRRRSA
ncbi:MAG: myxosortase-dependent M36 family metallopeptidase [Archangium sp.]